MAFNLEQFKQINDPLGSGTGMPFVPQGLQGNPFGTFGNVTADYSGITTIDPGGFGGEVVYRNPSRAITEAGGIEQFLSAARGGGGGGGGGGGYRAPRIDLDPFRQRELSAMERLLDLKFKGVRKELRGGIAEARLARRRNIAEIERARRRDVEASTGNAVSRGILDSGIFLRDQARIETQAAEQKSGQIADAAATIGGIRSQLGLLSAQKAAEIASQRAQIERAYMLARLSQG